MACAMKIYFLLEDTMSQDKSAKPVAPEKKPVAPAGAAKTPDTKAAGNDRHFGSNAGKKADANKK